MSAKTASKQKEARPVKAACPPCKPCAPIWPAVLLAIAGTLLIVVSTWQMWGKEKVREQVKTEECDKCEDVEKHLYNGRQQADAPVAMLKVGNNFVLRAPNGIQINLPVNSAGELSYEVEATYGMESTGVAMDHNKIDWYMLSMRYNPNVANAQGMVSPIVYFSINYVNSEDAILSEITNGDELVTVKYLGQTRDGLSVVMVEGENSGDGSTIFNLPVVSSLTRANLRATNYLVKRSDLVRSQFVKSIDGSGSTWSLSSGRTVEEMSEAELAETIQILSSVR
ncbi:hypothetical protein FWG76_01915 [Candidatus Saccharibacteria bacterium]|nr:hypothetical protein [Candidatus Saccharibacteria bacterium]